MKNILKMCLMCFFLIGGSLTVNAQLFKKLKKKVVESVEQKVEKRLEKKADEKSDDVLDAIFDKEKKENNDSQKDETQMPEKQEENTGGFDMGGMMDILNNQGKAVYEDTYTFPITVTMEVSNGGSAPMQMRQGYGENAMMSSVENTPGDIITDFKNETIIMLDIENASAQVMSMGFMNMMGMGGENEESSEEKQPVITKTGNTKTMHGYSCYEYTIVAEGVSMKAWFAPDVNFNYQDYLKGFVKMFAGAKSNPGTLLNQGLGYVMQMESTDERGEFTTMEVTAISEEARTITLSDYTIQKL